MSRYTVYIGTIEYAYGFDEPLQEYFFDKCDSALSTDENEGGYIFQVSNHYSMLPHPDYPVTKEHYSNGDIMTIVKDEERKMGRLIWKEEHYDALGGDLKF
jgi:hypothetical protein